ncbi:hypothetical protein EVAR_22159_1 [Eumeta japonica]|uniref:Uncharacterized protein n=1 Tax=Eumeta variegata TaxID=151549 RepID=A0A4C1W2I7_EUMVA|nr:hypothetical protein EVAR_22159_1 [Eumeta japonica]
MCVVWRYRDEKPAKCESDSHTEGSVQTSALDPRQASAEESTSKPIIAGVKCLSGGRSKAKLLWDDVVVLLSVRHEHFTKRNHRRLKGMVLAEKKDTYPRSRTRDVPMYVTSHVRSNGRRRRSLYKTIGRRNKAPALTQRRRGVLAGRGAFQM